MGTGASAQVRAGLSRCYERVYDNMQAEARLLSKEIFTLVDRDSSGKISKSEFAAAHRIITKVSTDLLPAAIADLDENKDGEVDQSEWDGWMDTVFRSLGPETFRSVCFRSLRAVRDASGDTSRLHPWIDIDFSKLGQKMTPIVGADKRGITRPQLRKLLRFIASHADEVGNLRGWWTGAAKRVSTRTRSTCTP